MSLDSKSKLLEKLLKKKPANDKKLSINISTVFSLAIHDPLIFLNVVERVFVNYLSQWKTSDCAYARSVLVNIVSILGKLCKLISCYRRY